VFAERSKRESLFAAHPKRQQRAFSLLGLEHGRQQENVYSAGQQIGGLSSQLTGGAPSEEKTITIGIPVVEILHIIQELRHLLDLVDQNRSDCLIGFEFSHQPFWLGFVASSLPPVLQIHYPCLTRMPDAVVQ
jgi:hypothetical protein